MRLISFVTVQDTENTLGSFGWEIGMIWHLMSLQQYSGRLSRTSPKTLQGPNKNGRLSWLLHSFSWSSGWLSQSFVQETSRYTIPNICCPRCQILLVAIQSSSEMPKAFLNGGGGGATMNCNQWKHVVHTRKIFMNACCAKFSFH